MDYFICTILLVVLGLALNYGPSIDVTKEGDVLLWYYDKTNQRKWKKLFNIKFTSQDQ